MIFYSIMIHSSRKLRRLLITVILFVCLFTVLWLIKRNSTRPAAHERPVYINETLVQRYRRNEPISKPTNFSGIYVREAFRISDDEIRLVYLENNDNRFGLRAAFGDHQWQSVDWWCFNETCMDYLFCSMATRFGSIHVPLELQADPVNEIRLTADGYPEYTKLAVNDVRLKSEYEHQLGVCLQPIFFFTDWTIIVQFFEAWLSQGATKFYFYVHSYTRQSKLVLDAYKLILSDRLEIINWSDLPVAQINKHRYYKDPNARVFRHGAIAFMHDCMLRARGNVKFISNTDLDDLPVSKGSSMTNILNQMAEEYPNAAQFKFDWHLAHQPQNWDAISKASDIHFNMESIKVLKTDNIRWDYRVSKKIIHRPERVKHFDMHSVYQNEERGYTTVEMFDNPNAYFLHLRRFERNLIKPPYVTYNSSFNYEPLREQFLRMEYSYRARLEQFGNISDTSMSPWAVEARETFRNLEQCRREAFGTILDDKNEMCQQSSAGCEGMLQANIDFVKAPLTWINLAERGLFNNYVEEKNSLLNWFLS